MVNYQSSIVRIRENIDSEVDWNQNEKLNITKTLILTKNLNLYKFWPKKQNFY